MFFFLFHVNAFNSINYNLEVCMSKSLSDYDIRKIQNQQKRNIKIGINLIKIHKENDYEKCY